MADVSLPMASLERMASLVRDVDAATQEKLQRNLAAIDLSDRRAVGAVMRGWVESGAGAATKVAGLFYRGMSMLQTGEDFDPLDQFEYDQDAADVALAGMYNQADGDMDMLQRLISERVSFEVNRAAKVGVWRNGQYDSRDVRYARVPVGVETCAWCLMTAGLGFWYMTEEAASHTHFHCDCQIIPSIGGTDMRIRGYDPTVGRDMWRNSASRLRSGNIPQELRDRIDKARAQHESRTSEPWKPVNEELIAMRYFYGLEH